MHQNSSEQTRQQKKEKVKQKSQQKFEKIMMMMENDVQNYQMAIDMFADNAKFKTLEYQSREAKIKYFQQYFESIIYVSLYKIEKNFQEFTDYLMTFCDWIENHQFPLPKKKQDLSASKKNVSEMVDQRQEIKKVQTVLPKQKQPTNQIEKEAKIEPPIVKVEQSQETKLQAKQPEKISTQTVTTTPTTNNNNNNNLQKQQVKIEHSYNYGQNIDKQETRVQELCNTNRTYVKTQTHGNRYSYEEGVRKVLTKIYDCYDHPEKRSKIKTEIQTQIESLRKMQISQKNFRERS